MKILAIDTTAKTSTVAVTEDEQLLALYTQQAGLTHTQTVLPVIETILKNCDLSVGDIDAFACSKGPGSFTGVRIGAAIIKGLAFGRERSCIGVSTLKALAMQFADFPCDGALICPVMDARRGQVYNALFSLKNGLITPLCDDRAIEINTLSRELADYDKPIYFTGDGYFLAQESISLPNVQKTPRILQQQNAYAVALTALEQIKSGLPYDNDITLLPSYLRASQAEQSKQK